jgi:hypothetical protein
MPRKTIDQVLSDGEQIARVWADNPTFTLGTMTLPQLQTLLTELRGGRDQIEVLRTQLTGLLNDSGAKTKAITDVLTRFRSGMRAVFGPDSTQYEQAGGTRISEHKPRRPKSGS